MLNPEESTAAIQKQLNQIGKDLKLTIGIDAKEISRISDDVKKIQKQLSGSNVKLINESDIRDSKTFFTTIEAIQNTYKEMGTTKLSKVFDPLSGDLKQINLELNEADGKIKKLKFEAAQVKGVHGIDGFVLTGSKEVDNTALQMEKALSQTIVKRQADEKRLAEEQAKAANRNLENEKLITKEIERQLALFQKQKNIDATNLKRTLGSSIDTNAISSSIGKVNNASPSDFSNLKQLRDWQQDVNVGFKEISSTARTSSSHVLGFGEALQTAMVKFCRLKRKLFRLLVRKKPGMLNCKSEWKANLNKLVTRNA